MGHIFIVCGAPGVGKTTLLKIIHDRKIPLKQLRRITTRPPRVEEGDQGTFNLEYEFMSREEFSGRLAKGDITNFIEWNGNLYATEFSILHEALQTHDDCLLFEDMPSALHLKKFFCSCVTVILLFTGNKEELLKIDFSALNKDNSAAVLEWKRRLGVKYKIATGHQPGIHNDDLDGFIMHKMTRAIPDLAFMVGKIKSGEDIIVLANKENEIEKTVVDFQNIVSSVHDCRNSL